VLELHGGERLGRRIEARQLVAERERDPDRAVGRDLERVRADVRIRARVVGWPARREHAAERQVAGRDRPRRARARRGVEPVELVLGHVDRVDAAVRVHGQVVLERRAAAEIPFLDHRAAHLGRRRRREVGRCEVRRERSDRGLGRVGVVE
jgi:hypothetical protein